MSIRLTVGQAIVKFMAAQYSERDGIEQPFFAGMFGIFGHGNVTGPGQALEEYREHLTYYRPQNEQAMVHTAVAYAKMKDRLQTYACTSSVGPGALNMVTGAGVATVNRLPVLLLPGDTFANRLPHPVLQQLESPAAGDISVNDCFRPVSRFFDRINRPEQLLAALPEAMRILTDPAETGAVTIALPEDVQTEAYDWPESFLSKRVWRIPRNTPEQSVLEQAAALIADAERPLIVSGGGTIYSGAGEALDEFATQVGIPISETQAGKGIVHWDHPWNVGPVGANGGSAANSIAQDADLVIAVGTRLSDFTTSSHTAFQHPHVKFIGINVGALDAFKFGALPVIGDARAVLEALTPLVLERGISRDLTDYAHVVADLKRDWDGEVDALRAITNDGVISQAEVMGIVNDASGPRDVVINAAGSMPGDLLKLWRAEDPKSHHVEYGFSCMGYEIAAGLGAKLACPDREVFVFVGDGSYLMLHTELVTAIQEGVKFIVILVDNGGFQSIHGLQMGSGTPSFGNELRFRDQAQGALVGDHVPIDWVKNAESYGAHAVKATDADSFRAAVREAIAAEKTTLIAIRTDKNKRVPNFGGWWDVPIAEVSGEESVRTTRENYLEDRKKQRFYY